MKKNTIIVFAIFIAICVCTEDECHYDFGLFFSGEDNYTQQFGVLLKPFGIFGEFNCLQSGYLSRPNNNSLSIDDTLLSQKSYGYCIGEHPECNGAAAPPEKVGINMICETMEYLHFNERDTLR